MLGEFKLAERNLNLNSVEEPSFFDSFSWGNVGDALVSGVQKFSIASDVVANSKVIYDNFGKTQDEVRRENIAQDSAKKPATNKTQEVNAHGVSTNNQILLVGGGLLALVLLLK